MASDETPPPDFGLAGLTADPILFGADTTVGIVAVEPLGDDRVQVYLRQPGQPICVEEDRLESVAWVGGDHGESLAGELAMTRLVRSRSWEQYLSIMKALKSGTLPFFGWQDPVVQYLSGSGRTHFKGMDFDDLRRMQIDIETNASFGFPHADRDPLAAIAVADSSGWEEFLHIEPGNEASEKAAIQRLTQWIQERDPDVIEGHNIFNFDLPFLAARARKYRIKLLWGRGGEPVTSRPSRIQIADKAIQFEKFAVRGRHIIDTWILAQHYDVATRELQGFGLKAVARQLGVSEPDRVHLDGGSIAEAYRAGDADFVTYAMQDVRETRAVAAALSRSYFVQAQIFPFSYQDVILRGNATKIDTLLCREYLRQRHSLPPSPPSEPYEGAMTDVFETGVLQNIWHCDATSLYPSIMLAFGIFPKSDALGIFPGLLENLRQFRLRAKSALRDATRPDAAARLEALQGTFKILINSFYGYLGFAQGHFADFAAARDVTARGRQILTIMLDWLRSQGARVIEMDTDGIYFQPPAHADAESWRRGLAGELPEGIEVEFDRTFQAMFSYKTKNYALLGHDGSLTIKGAALKSRGMEPYLRTYLERLLRLLLEGGPAASLAEETRHLITSRNMPVAQLARTETLQDSPDAYQRKIAASSRNRSAAYELALRSRRDYRAGDQITYYITGHTKSVRAFEAAKPIEDHDPANPDENLAYYAAKFDDLTKKFDAFLPRSDDLFGGKS